MPAPLQSASGYGALDSTPLARPGYYSKIIARIYERDFIPDIVNTEIDDEILRCHQQVQIMKAPDVGPWRNLMKNQEMVPNQVTADAVTLSICNAAYNDIKIDTLDIRWACDRWESFEAKFLDAVYERYVEMIRRWVLTAMVMEASPQNRGAKAGIHGDIDLGSVGNPVEVTPTNIPLRFAQLQRVLLEQLWWRDNEMFIILPSAFRTTLALSNYANMSWIGERSKSVSVNVDGLWDQQLGGFNVIETVHAPIVRNDGGRVCYYIIAGNRNAFAFASNIIEGRVVYPHRTFSAEYQMLAVWGGKMIYPEGIAVGYWTFVAE